MFCDSACRVPQRDSSTPCLSCPGEPLRTSPTASSLPLWVSPSARSARPFSGLHLEPLTLEISPQIGEQLELLRTTQVGNYALEDRADGDVLDLRRVSLLPLKHLIVLTLISDE